MKQSIKGNRQPDVSVQLPVLYFLYVQVEWLACQSPTPKPQTLLVPAAAKSDRLFKVVALVRNA